MAHTHFVTIPSIHLLTPTCGGCKRSKVVLMSFHKGPGGSWGLPRLGGMCNPSSVFGVWVSSQLDIPWIRPQGGIKLTSWSDASTISTGSFQCEGGMVLLWGPSGYPSGNQISSCCSFDHYLDIMGLQCWLTGKLRALGEWEANYEAIHFPLFNNTRGSNSHQGIKGQSTEPLPHSYRYWLSP